MGIADMDRDVTEARKNVERMVMGTYIILGASLAGAMFLSGLLGYYIGKRAGEREARGQPRAAIIQSSPVEKKALDGAGEGLRR